MSLSKNQISKAVATFWQGHERSVRAKKNIALSLLCKGFSILISLLLVPLTLTYLNATEYGIWLTLSSILTWINFFDIGLGNGLRNKLTEALTLGDREKARIYVSTSFALLALIVMIFFLIFALVNPFLEWSKILNTPAEAVAGLGSVVVVVFAFFCLQFLFKTVGIVFIAAQKPALNDLLGLISSALSLGIIYLLTRFTQSSLYYVALSFSAVPVVVFVATYFLIFYSKYSFLRPSWKCIRLKYSRSLMGLGLKFFIIQIALLIVFTTSNIIISQVLGPEEVTTYNIAFKYFSVVTMGFSILLAPLWNAYTEAWTRGDIPWIKNTIRRNIQIWALSLVGTLLLVLCSEEIYRWWVGTEVRIPFSLSLGCALYVTISNWNGIFAHFLSGIGKLQTMLIHTIINVLLFIPCTLFFAQKWGVSGVILSLSLFLFIGSVLLPIQYKKIISNTATGFWNQ